MRSQLAEPPRLFTHTLHGAGYYVSWPAKTDFNFDPDARQDGTTWRDDAEDWVGRLRDGTMPDAPWFVYDNIGITHESAMWPPPAEGEEGEGARYWRWMNPGLKMPEAVTSPEEVRVPAYLPDTEAVRADIVRHYDNIHALDKRLGETLDALDASGQRDNTLVVFIADHGRGLPREKRWPYAAGLHMPLIAWWPGRIAAGSVSDRLISWVDLAPTFLAAAGLEPDPRHDGTAFLDAQGVVETPGPDVVFGGRDRMDSGFDRVRAAIDGRFLLIRNDFPQLPYAQYLATMEKMPTMKELRRLHAEEALSDEAALFMALTKPPLELYDWRADPDCVRNLANDPAHGPVVTRLSDALQNSLAGGGDLGLIAEQELNARGLLIDILPRYRQRIKHQPTRWKNSLYHTRLTMDEAR
jgi:uncharacterized sulfatase